MSKACHFTLVANLHWVWNGRSWKLDLSKNPLFYYIKGVKSATSTFKICNFKTSEGFATKLKWQAFDIYEIEWPKVGGIYWPLSIISAHFKKAILLYGYLMGYRYFCPYLYQNFKLHTSAKESNPVNFFKPILKYLPAPLSFGYYHMWILQLGLGRYQTMSR